MAQFDIYRNINSESNELIPYLLDIQSDLFNILITRVVVPLRVSKAIKPAKKLNPIFQVENTEVMMLTQELASIHSQQLGDKISNLSKHRNEIIGALDFLFTGI